MRDPIIAEIRRVREAYAERFGYDIYAMLRDLKERQMKSDREVVSLSPRYRKSLEQTSLAAKTTGV